jgi:hypothetical protein
VASSPSVDPWAYLGEDQAAALESLSARLGAEWAGTDEDVLIAAYRDSVDRLHRVTGRFFQLWTGEIRLDGNDLDRLDLPWPVVGTDAGGDSISSASVFSPTGTETELDLADLAWDDRAFEGPTDPRRAPAIGWRDLARRWPAGRQNVAIVGSWGYLEADGATPRLVVQTIVDLVAWELRVGLDRDELRRGLVIQETTGGRSYTLGASSSSGMTGDRRIDQSLAALRAPARIRSSLPTHQIARGIHLLRR